MKNLNSDEHSKAELIRKLSDMIRVAENMPIEELCKTGDYDVEPNLKYPQTKSEHIITEALGLLLSQDWVDNDPILDDIASVLGQLDTGVNKIWAWQKLFRLAKEIK